MCGIAGSVERRSSPNPEVLERQLRTLLHRGPDATGQFVARRGAIGQTRLAIIDLVTGNPPITTPDSRVGVALNGEIYNFRELRDELREKGHRFLTSGDTEVIAHLAESLEPEDLAARLLGMFAFAVWDSEVERLILARDRLGKKPLYWWCDGTTFVFASEIKALLIHPAVSADLDEDALPAYLSFGYVPTPRTFFRGIQSLPPGHVMCVNSDLQIAVEPYWTPDVHDGDGHELPVPDAPRLIRQLLDEAVRDRLVSDVPLGAFLSGGIDSSVVVALMAQHGPVNTFTIGFDDDQGYDERSWAELVAKRFGTNHTTFVAQPDAIELLEKMVWHHDQPFGDSSAIPTYLLAELTRQHVTVALCGDGGDELFAGYERFLAGVALARVGPFARLLRPLAGRRLFGAPSRLSRFLATAGQGMPDAYRQWVGYIADRDVRDLTPGGSQWGVDDYRRIWASLAPAPPLTKLLELNLRTYLVDDLLPKVDRMSMAVGLEVRAPFLDHRLVEVALRLPPRLHLRRGRLKALLKDSVADLLPREVLNRPKKGFGVPLDRWFREDLSTYVTSMLGDPRAAVRSHLRPAAIDRLLGEHDSGAVDRGHELWTLLTLETFLRGRGWR